MPFREPQLKPEAMPQVRGTASETRGSSAGKPEAFRKGRGKAAAVAPLAAYFRLRQKLDLSLESNYKIMFWDRRPTKLLLTVPLLRRAF